MDSAPQTERRRSKRFPLDSTIAVKMPDGVEYKCTTKDISAGGIFFYCDARIEPASPIKLVIKLPPEITCGDAQWVCFHGRVARVEESVEWQRGVGVKIERIAFLPGAVA